MNKLSTVITAALKRDAATKVQKQSLQANRAEDPTPRLSDTRQTLGVHHSYTRPRFRRGDFVINADQPLSLTGVNWNSMAREVVDVERHETGWMVGVERCEGRYEHESNYILLEDVDQWIPHCEKGVFFWIKTAPQN